MKSRLFISLFACLVCLKLFAPTEELFGNYNFTVEIEGINAGAFSEVSGLGAEIAVEEYNDGETLIVRKRPGRTKYADITLKRGYIGRSDILDWFEQIGQGTTIRRSMVLNLQDAEGAFLGSWTLYGCWPKQWKVSNVTSDGTALVEEIGMVVEQVIFQAP